MKKKNPTDEIRTLCNAHENFKKALEKRLATPIELMKDVFRKLPLKGVPFQVVDPASLEEIQGILINREERADKISSIQTIFRRSYSRKDILLSSVQVYTYRM